jgi:hypothetical protein
MIILLRSGAKKNKFPGDNYIFQKQSITIKKSLLNFILTVLADNSTGKRTFRKEVV